MATLKPVKPWSEYQVRSYFGLPFSGGLFHGGVAGLDAGDFLESGTTTGIWRHSIKRTVRDKVFLTDRVILALVYALEVIGYVYEAEPIGEVYEDSTATLENSWMVPRARVLAVVERDPERWRRQLGRWGPLIVGVFSDAPESVKAEWL